jgi:hypothetical protein
MAWQLDMQHMFLVVLQVTCSGVSFFEESNTSEEMFFPFSFRIILIEAMISLSFSFSLFLSLSLSWILFWQ